MDAIASLDRYASYYKDQTIFLTGGTGGLGTCLLFKLSVELPTKKIYALVRSEEKAIKTWRTFIPDQIDAILRSGNVMLVTGDIRKSNLGIEKKVLAEISSEATVVINLAANTSFTTTISQAVSDNCFSALEAATVAASFSHLAHFIQVSTTYCNAFLPEGSVSEAIHSFYDPETELHTILATGTSPNASRFPWPYAHSKHLSEQLLLSRFPTLPILIVRPSCIGSAVRSPYAGYGPMKSTPIEMFWRVHALNPGDGVFHAAQGSTTGTNIFDEIPVDWVSNLILLHSVKGTRGVVHASTGTFVPRSFDHSRELYSAQGDSEIVWTTDRSLQQCFTPNFYKVTTGDWRFETGRSNCCKKARGPLSVNVRDVDLAAYDKLRRKKVRKDIDAAVARARKMALMKVNEKVMVQDGLKRESRL